MAKVTLLAHSTPVWHLKADPDWMNDKLFATVALSRALGIERGKLREIFNGQQNDVMVAENLDEQGSKAVQQVLHQYRQQFGERLHGLYLRPDYKRTYPQGPIAPHTLGFLLDDGSGGGGVEAVLQTKLAGVPGEEHVIETARSEPMPDDRFQMVPPQAGAQVQLTWWRRFSSGWNNHWLLRSSVINRKPLPA